MKEQEIIEGNKLIAIFDGWVLNNEYPDKDRTYTKNGNIELDTTFKYHKDWNLLMDLVEKIESLGFDSRIHGNNSDDGYLCDFVQADINNEISCCVTWQDVIGTKIEATFKAVVEFIKWYK